MPAQHASEPRRSRRLPQIQVVESGRSRRLAVLAVDALETATDAQRPEKIRVRCAVREPLVRVEIDRVAERRGESVVDPLEIEGSFDACSSIEECLLEREGVRLPPRELVLCRPA